MLELKEKPAPARPVPPPPEGTVPDWSGKGKEQAVQRMFTGIARWYDLNNSLLSFGLHHRWKRLAVKYLFEPSASACGFRSGEVSAEPRYALDIGAGTGDLALLIQPRMGEAGRVAAVDLNQAMLQEGLRKIAGRGLHGRITCLRANAEQLGFLDNSFDAVTTGFCIRNVSDLLRACTEICRVLKPGGRFVCLEFSRPAHAWLLRLYDWYSFSLLPKIGTLVAHDRTGVYRYLPASIRAFPDQEGLKALLLKAGFRHVDYYNVSGGIVAIHVATK